ncbi:hypothetical protein D3C72_2526950 [compost metagenome]
MIEAGSAHLLPFVSLAMPLLIGRPACPTTTRSALENEAAFLAMPLIFTLLDSASSCAVAGLNDR